MEKYFWASIYISNSQHPTWQKSIYLELFYCKGIILMSNKIVVEFQIAVSNRSSLQTICTEYNHTVMQCKIMQGISDLFSTNQRI